MTGSASWSPTGCSSRSTSVRHRRRFQDVAIDAFTYDGQTYGLPYAVENIALVRNTDLVPEAPATFEEMIAAATDYKASTPTTDLPGAGPAGRPRGRRLPLQPILTAFGGYVFAQNEDGTFNPDDLGIDSPGRTRGGGVPRRAGGAGRAQR